MKEEHILQKKQTMEDILLAQMPIPEKLLTSYTTLGLLEVDVMLVLQIYRFMHRGKEFPTPKEIASHLSIGEQECAAHLKKLIQKNMLEIKELKNKDDQLSEAYSLEPLWEKLFTEETPSQQQQQQQEEGDLFVLFEREFGRPISPFEIETINVWLDEDKMRPALIKAALREAVLMGKLNFKYIDRMLREWQKKGIRSVKQAKDASRAFRGSNPEKQYQREERDTSVYFNWLKGD